LAVVEFVRGGGRSPGIEQQRGCLCRWVPVPYGSFIYFFSSCEILLWFYLGLIWVKFHEKSLLWLVLCLVLLGG